MTAIIIISIYHPSVNSAVGVCWLASAEVIIQVLFTSKRPKRHKIAFPFPFHFRKGNSFNERGGCTKKHKNGNKVFNGKLFNLSSLILNGEKSKYNALFTKTVEH